MDNKNSDSYEENRIQDIPLSEVFDAILLFFPEITRSDVKFLYHGTYNVFEVKQAYIFRFPDKTFRNESGVKLIRREVKILNSIRELISFSIPEPEYILFDPDNPLMGYKKIEGLSLSRCFESFPVEELLKIGKEIAKFLSELHSKEILYKLVGNEIISGEFSPISYHAYWNNYYEMVEERIFPLLSKLEREWVHLLFSRFLDNKANFRFNPVVIHGDFDTSNILIDTHTHKITGVIDFEETRMYDPAADFLFFEEGHMFSNQIISNYKGSIDSNFEERRRFLFGRTCLAYIEFGITHDMKDMVNWGLNRLRIIMDFFFNI